jgi:hypothetical protein
LRIPKEYERLSNTKPYDLPSFFSSIF